MYGEMSKWVAQIDDPARIPEMVSRAFHLSVSGRPGPVVLALPEDMQQEQAEAADGERYHEVQAHPGAADLETMRDMLAAARRPFVLLGGGGWTDQACADITAFAEANGLPVAVGFRRQDLFDNTHPNYVGVMGLGISPALNEMVRNADLILAVGPQLGEFITQGYTLFDFPRLRQKLIHVTAGVGELGKVYQGELLINAGMAQFAAAARDLRPVDGAAWKALVVQAHAAFEAYTRPVSAPGALNFSEVMGWLGDNLPDDAIVTNGAGNYTVWVHRFFKFRRYHTQLAPQSGAMGYGVPAGVAAALLHPDRTVVSISGDGCFLMNGQEIATAVQYGARVIFIVVNNGMYGTIRMHQERSYPGRVSGTGLVNPDFAALAGAYGCHAEVVDSTAGFAPAFEAARAVDGPSLIELRVDPEAILPGNTLAAMRAAAAAKPER
jgi:acetolactate synthase-1/2/3 large subunit